MKKPDIEILSEYAEGHYNGVFVNQELLCICHEDKKSDAVRSMIDALIESKQEFLSLKKALYDEGYRGSALHVSKRISVIDKALKKAGCHDS